MNIADLAEAEVRALRDSARSEAVQLRRALGHLGIAFVLLIVGTLLSATGLCLLGLGLFNWLEVAVGRTEALAILGFVCLVGAGVCIWIYSRMTIQ